MNEDREWRHAGGGRWVLTIWRPSEREEHMWTEWANQRQNAVTQQSGDLDLRNLLNARCPCCGQPRPLQSGLGGDLFVPLGGGNFFGALGL